MCFSILLDCFPPVGVWLLNVQENSTPPLLSFSSLLLVNNYTGIDPNRVEENLGDDSARAPTEHFQR